MSTKPVIWILLIALYLDAVECQWGLSFGWFWGNVEDLKSSKVESGVVKSSSYFPGSKTKTALFDVSVSSSGDDDSSSSEEDSFAIVSSTNDRQGRDRTNYRMKSRNSKGVRRRKKLGKYGRGSKSLKKGKNQSDIQKLRKRYKSYIRRKYGRKARKGTIKYKQQKSKSRDQNIASRTPRKDRTSILEEIMNQSQDSHSTLNTEVGAAPSTKQVFQTNAQGSKPNAKVKKAGLILNNQTKLETTTNTMYEQEVETENEITDALETEGQSTLPTTTTTELTTPESEYEPEYYGGMDLFGDALNIFRPIPDLNEGKNMQNNETGRSEQGKVQNKGIGRDLNTQASPLKSNDVAMQNLQKPPQSKPGSSNFETNSSKGKLSKQDTVTAKGSNISDPAYTKEIHKPILSTPQSQQSDSSKSININPKITSGRPSLPQQMVSISAQPEVAAPQYQKFVSSKIMNTDPKSTSGRPSSPRQTVSIPIKPTDKKLESSNIRGISPNIVSGRPSGLQQTISFSTKPADQKFESSKRTYVNRKIASGRRLRPQQTVSIPAEAERRYLEKHKNSPTALQLGVEEKSFTLHADHPQAWKSYDIIDPKQNIIYEGESIMNTPKETKSATIKGKLTQGQKESSYKASIYKETSKHNPVANRGMFQANKLSQGNVISNGGGDSVNKQSGKNIGKAWYSNIIIPNNYKSKSNLRPGDSIINGKNGKKINALFTNTDRQTEEGQKTSLNELIYQTPSNISSIRNKNISHANEYSQKYSVSNGGLFSAMKLPGAKLNKNGKFWNSDRTISNVQNNLNLKPGDSIGNGKNINTLYPKVRKTTTRMPKFSSKIEKTWVDAFLPEKFTAPKRTNQEPVKTTSSSSLNGTIRSKKVVAKSLEPSFRLSQTTHESANVLLSRLGTKVKNSKPFIPARFDASLSRYSKAAKNISQSLDVHSKGAIVNVSNQNSEITAKNRPIATLSHMPSSVTAIPSEQTRSSWDTSVNDRMSYKYKTPEAKLEKNFVLRKNDNSGLSHQSPTISGENNEQTKAGMLAKWSTKKNNNQPRSQDNLNAKIAEESNKTRQFEPVVNSDFNMGVKGRLQPQRASNLISGGFPSRINKEIFTKTDTKVDIYPDIPSQGDVHIKLPEIPTRLTKELGQGDRTNSHQKSPPEPPVVVEQIQVPTNSVFSYPSSNKTEKTFSSTSIDGRLINKQQPPATAKKLQLTLLETEQKPNSRIAAPLASSMNQSKKAKSKMIQAQHIQLIPYSNAIPMKIFDGKNKHSGYAPSHQLSPLRHSGGKRHDKPIKDHGTSKMQSNLLEKQSEAHIKSNLGHKEYNSHFRLTSAEIMTSPSRKERLNATLPSGSHFLGNLPKIRTVNDSGPSLHGTKTGGGRNIISEMKSQLRKNVTSIHDAVPPNTLEYQGTPVKVEKIPNVSLLSKQNRSKESKTALKVHNVAFSGKHLKQAPHKSSIYNNVESGKSKPSVKYSALNIDMRKTNVREPGQRNFTQGGPRKNTSNKMGAKNLKSFDRYNVNKPQPKVSGSSNSTTTNSEIEIEHEGQLQTTRSRIQLGLKTTSSPSTTNSEYEVEQEQEEKLQTTQQSSPSTTTSAGEIENEVEEEQIQSTQRTPPTQQSTTQQQEYEYENEYPSTMGGQTGGRGNGRGPQMIGAAGYDIFSGSWKETVRENAREIALEMEGTWTAVNGTTIGGKNTCPSYKMRYQENAVVFDTIVDQCRVIITWNKRQQREQVQEKVWWGVNTYYRSRTIFVPVVTYVDLR